MKIHKEGLASISFVIIISAALSYMCLSLTDYHPLAWVLTVILAGFAIFVISFFRVPKRSPKGNSHEISAPADGKIVIIEEVEEPEYFEGKRLQVSIFMSFFNVHANWVPMTGVISHYKYHPGNYLAAWHPKSSTKNERTTIVIKNEDGTEILCRQIAGLVARRVVCYAHKGKHFNAGDEIGFIKFGSRADLFLPLGTEVLVKKGDKVTGAETIIAKLK